LFTIFFPDVLDEFVSQILTTKLNRKPLMITIFSLIPNAMVIWRQV